LKSEQKQNSDKDKEIQLTEQIKRYTELYKYFEKYEEFLSSIGKIDFDDMVLSAIKKLKENPELLKNWENKYDHVIVDEFQDNNSLQTELARLLSPEGHITVVGDEDQCIYTFQGAHEENFDQIRDHFSKFSPENKILRTNYRSTEEIVNSSQQLMNVEKERQPKNLKAFEGNGKGVKPELHEFHTVNDEFSFIKEKLYELRDSGISLKDCAILFRKNKEIREFTNFLGRKPNQITLSTIHKVKGKEYSIVFVSHLENGSIPTNYRESELTVPKKLQQFPSNKDDSISHKKEERRMFYVAMTRAKHQLFLTYHF